MGDSEDDEAMPDPGVRMLDVDEAAARVGVDADAIEALIAEESVPYLKLEDGSFRIPERALAASLSEAHDLAAEVRALDRQNADTTDEKVLDALAEDER